MSHTLSLPVVRFSLAGFISFLITFLLFFFMQDLIRNSIGFIPVDNSPPVILNYVRVIFEEPVKRRERVTPPPIAEEQPQPPDITPFDNSNLESTPIIIGEIPPEIGPGPTPAGGVSAGEGDFLPIVKVQPIYPRPALSRGIEGYPIVEYTVTALGTTRDIQVIEAEPASIFNQASIDAAARFKYKPRVVNGTAMEVRGVQNKFTFVLE